MYKEEQIEMQVKPGKFQGKIMNFSGFTSILS